jgi:DNA-binding response OmpR family regulator
MNLSQAENLIAGKRLLIVDDEKDVLDTLVFLLRDCKIDAASSFEEAKKLLETNSYDLAILDIMGVDGYGLLDLAVKRKIPALMLTAHALSREDLTLSAKSGASYFVPKDKMSEIAIYIADVLEAKEESKSAWGKWFERLGGFFDQKFGGTDWRDRDKDLWERMTRSYS